MDIPEASLHMGGGRMTEWDPMGANEGVISSAQGAVRWGGLVREGFSKEVCLDPGLFFFFRF